MNALRSDLKKSRNVPAFTSAAAVINMVIDNQTTIARSDRFTRTVSCQPLAVRVRGSRFDAASNVIETHKQKREFHEP